MVRLMNRESLAWDIAAAHVNFLACILTMMSQCSANSITVLHDTEVVPRLASPLEMS
jgi:hypothetical protein